MSYSHNQRKKIINLFKKTRGKEWYSYFREFVTELEKKELGVPICTFADLYQLK